MSCVEISVSSSRNVTVINPLDLLIDAVIKSAYNSDEKLLAKEGRQRILDFHKKWNEILGKQTDIPAIAEIVASRRWASRAPYYVHSERDESGYVDYPTVTLVEKAVVEGRELLPAPDFLTRILFKLGAFTQDKTEPPIIFGSLLTFIPGISLTVEMNSYNPLIRAQMEMETFQQALSLPITHSLPLREERISRIGRLRSFAYKFRPRKLVDS